MKRQHVIDWIKALRSGDYQQGFGALCDHGDKDFCKDIPFNKYCCLGVFCVINGEPTNTCSLPETIQTKYGFPGATKYADLGILPFTVRERRLSNIEQQATLGELNDSGFSFSQIADVIEYFYLPEAT